MKEFRHDSHVHLWFGLTYASYLVLPRSLLQEMPVEWQKRFVDCLKEMGETFEQENDNYAVNLRDDNGRFIKDPLSQYRRPDRDAIERFRLKKSKTEALGGKDGK